MANLGGIIIQNSTGGALIAVLVGDPFSCCDSPQSPGSYWIATPSGQTPEIPFQKTSGHGCDGKQGEFTLQLFVVTNGNTNAGSQGFSFDSDANLNLIGPTPDPAKLIGKLSVPEVGGHYLYTVTLPS